jgi:rubrerythrin
MGNIFAGSEVVELGVHIEENGRDFYHALAAQTQDVKAKEVFQFLATEEEKHIVVFRKICSALEKYEPVESYPQEYFAYMKTLANEHIFTRSDKGKEMAVRVRSDKDAVEMGIAFEKDSIVFYEGMKQVVPPEDRKVIDSVIGQEQLHLKQLIDFKAQFKDS